MQVSRALPLLVCLSLSACGYGMQETGRNPLLTTKTIEELEAPFANGFLRITPEEAVDIVGTPFTERRRLKLLGVSEQGALTDRDTLVLLWQFTSDVGGGLEFPLTVTGGTLRVVNFGLVFDVTSGKKLIGFESRVQDLPYQEISVSARETIGTLLQFAQTFFLYQIAQAAQSIDDSVDGIEQSAGEIETDIDGIASDVNSIAESDLARLAQNGGLREMLSSEGVLSAIEEAFGPETRADFEELLDDL